MASKMYTVTIDCANLASLARFWASVLDYRIDYEDEEEVSIESSDGSESALLFVKVLDVKAVKNRIHFDLNPDDQATEVDRLMGLGATKVDIGQGDTTWVVMADPEGNEFCVLTHKDADE
ncbi:MAG: VOC family protein [Actinobacteria bacterium]|nr:VOC family protein [Actinomycetota bacterium]